MKFPKLLSMTLPTLLSIMFLTMLGSALAFIWYVRVLSIMATDAVLIGLVGTFGLGLLVGRRFRHAAPRRPAVVVPIDTGGHVMTLNRGAR